LDVQSIIAVPIIRGNCQPGRRVNTHTDLSGRALAAAANQRPFRTRYRGFSFQKKSKYLTAKESDRSTGDDDPIELLAVADSPQSQRAATTDQVQQITVNSSTLSVYVRSKKPQRLSVEPGGIISRRHRPVFMAVRFVQLTLHSLR
jgi:hypothetical protein